MDELFFSRRPDGGYPTFRQMPDGGYPGVWKRPDGGYSPSKIGRMMVMMQNFIREFYSSKRSNVSSDEWNDDKFVKSWIVTFLFLLVYPTYNLEIKLARFASTDHCCLRTDGRHIVSLFIHPQAPKYSARSPRVSQVNSPRLVTKLNMAAVCRELDRSYPCVIWISAECVLKMKTTNTSLHRHLLYSTLYLQKRNVF